MIAALLLAASLPASADPGRPLEPRELEAVVELMRPAFARERDYDALQLYGRQPDGRVCRADFVWNARVPSGEGPFVAGRFYGDEPDADHDLAGHFYAEVPRTTRAEAPFAHNYLSFEADHESYRFSRRMPVTVDSYAVRVRRGRVVEASVAKAAGGLARLDYRCVFSPDQKAARAAYEARRLALRGPRPPIRLPDTEPP